MAPRPMGVAILGLLLLLSGFGLLGVGFIVSFMPSQFAIGGLTNLTTNLVIFGGLGSSYQLVTYVALSLAFLFVLLGLGLWRGSNFARVFFMLIQVLQALLCLMFVASVPLMSVFGVGLSLAVVGYLHLPSVRVFFE